MRDFKLLVLGIESTCDETACSIVRGGREILSNVVASQTAVHEVFGGVVPELACRRHVDLIIPVIDQALAEAQVSLHEIDLIAVANAPGLIGAVLIGVNAAKALALALNKPLIGVNHIEAHLYAALMSHPSPVSLPCLGAVLSGGHTALLLIQDIGDYRLIGETVDDAIGEAFDKVAKMMSLPYPGGPHIERKAREGNPESYPLQPGKVKNSPFAFSFSGLKTAVLYRLAGQNKSSPILASLSEQDICNMAASFQQTAFRDIIHKTKAAAQTYHCQTVLFGGGVTNNRKLREMFAAEADGLELLWPSHDLSLDNAAMIAGLGYHQFAKRENQCGDSLALEAHSRWTQWT